LAGWLMQIVERKETSHTEANGEQACFDPGSVCIVTSIQSEPGRALGPRKP